MPASSPSWPGPRPAPGCSTPTTSPAGGWSSRRPRTPAGRSEPWCGCGPGRAVHPPRPCCRPTWCATGSPSSTTSCRWPSTPGRTTRTVRGRCSSWRDPRCSRRSTRGSWSTPATVGCAAAGPRCPWTTGSARSRSAGRCRRPSASASTGTTAARWGRRRSACPSPRTRGRPWATASSRHWAPSSPPAPGCPPRPCRAPWPSRRRWTGTCWCRSRQDGGPVEGGWWSPTPGCRTARSCARCGWPGTAVATSARSTSRPPGSSRPPRFRCRSPLGSRSSAATSAGSSSSHPGPRAPSWSATASNTYPASEVTAPARRHRGAGDRGRTAGRALPARHVGPARPAAGRVGVVVPST